MRCKWCNLNNPIYVDYHDNEWCVPKHDDDILFEMLILEGFQAGLSWECILNKRKAFQTAFDHFDALTVSRYTVEKVEELMQNTGIVRNRRKITAAIQNARVFLDIQQEFGSFSEYLWGFTDGCVVYEWDKTSSDLSDTISRDLKKRGMNFVGTTIIYSYLQSVGIIYSHDETCFLHKENDYV